MQTMVIYLTFRPFAHTDHPIIDVNVVVMQESGDDEREMHPVSFANVLTAANARVNRKDKMPPLLSSYRKFVDSPYHTGYDCCHYSIEIPASAPLYTFDLLGCIDSAVHKFEVWLKTKKDTVSVLFVKDSPGDDDPHHIAFLQKVMKGELTIEYETHNQLYRLIGNHMLQLVNSCPALKAFEEVAYRIKSFFEMPYPFRKICDYISPAPDYSVFLRGVTCDPLLQTLMHPAVSIQEKDKALLSWLKTLIQEKKEVIPFTLKNLPRFFAKGFDELFWEDELPASKPKRQGTDQAINQEINLEIQKFFKELERIQKLMRALWLSSLYSIVADDGGYYSVDYTEVDLLKQASFYYENGSMKIRLLDQEPVRPPEGGDAFALLRRYYNDPVYLRHYLPPDIAAKYGRNPGRNHTILERELRALTRALGLTILPDIDFHREPIVFDAASTDLLLPFGFHFSQAHARHLLKAAQFARIAISADENSTFKTLPKDLNATLISYLDVSMHDAYLVMGEAEASKARRGP